jgi:anti-sigma B factor antagonist
MNDLKDWTLGVAAKMSKVSITEQQVGDVIIIRVDGNIITGESAGTVRGLIHRLLTEGQRKILVDMAHVRWVDSMGIGELASALVSVTRAGGHFKLLKVRGNVKEILSITDLHTVFAIYDDEMEALNDYP